MFNARHDKYPKSLKKVQIHKETKLYVKVQNHIHYEEKSRKQMRKYRQTRSLTL